MDAHACETSRAHGSLRYGADRRGPFCCIAPRASALTQVLPNKLQRANAHAAPRLAAHFAACFSEQAAFIRVPAGEQRLPEVTEYFGIFIHF